MKKGLFFFVFWGVLFFSGCGKKKIEPDADFWYKKSLHELQFEPQGQIAWRKALGSLEQALEKNPNKSEYLALKGSLLLLLDMPTLGVHAFEQALKNVQTQEQRADVLNNYACALSQLGNEKEALSVWSQALAIASYKTPEVVYCNQGQHWLGKKNFEKALENFNRAIALAQEYSDAYFYAALSLMYLGQHDQAYDVVKTLLTLDAEYQPAKELKIQLEGMCKVSTLP